MTDKNKSKINQLMCAWQPGTVAVQPWLSQQGISPNLANWYLKSGWLEPVGRGAYRRPGDAVNWPGGLYALQKYLYKKVHVGAKSALELMGYGHYIRLGTKGNFYFFGEEHESLPAWFKDNSLWDITVKYFSTSLFANYQIGLIKKNINEIPIVISGLERAMMEALYLIPKHQSLDETYLLMQGLNNLRPKVVQELLENCRSIKVKRLFMHLAELHELPFLKHININNVDFGKGKRMIAGGGVYHTKYQLSLPRIREEE